MNGNRLLLDTNAVLYVLAGDETLASFLNNKELYLSIISELELLSFKRLTPQEVKAISLFVKEIKIENISDEVKKNAIELRKTTNLKLPDCIAATSMALQIPLVTADKQLSNISQLDVIYYQK